MGKALFSSIAACISFIACKKDALQHLKTAKVFGEQDIIDNETELILAQTGKQCYLFFLYDIFFFSP